MQDNRSQSFRCALGLAAFMLVAALAPRAGAQERDMALRIYSDIVFINEEGDWDGLAATLVPYSDGIKVLWRSAGPFVYPATLLNAVADGEFLVIEVPPEYAGYASGTCYLLQKGNTLTAVVVACGKV
jgi:hypothetical protein